MNYQEENINKILEENNLTNDEYKKIIDAL